MKLNKYEILNENHVFEIMTKVYEEVSNRELGPMESIDMFGNIINNVFVMEQRLTGDGGNILMSCYNSVIEKASRILYLCQGKKTSHDFHVETGILSFLAIFKMHGIKLDYSPEKIIELTEGMINKEFSYEDILYWVQSNRKRPIDSHQLSKKRNLISCWN